jgi:hypothetical protein
MSEYIVNCTMPRESRTYSERFNREDYFSDSDLLSSLILYCKNAVDLGWDVEAIDGDSRIVFISESGGSE